MERKCVLKVAAAINHNQWYAELPYETSFVSFSLPHIHYHNLIEKNQICLWNFRPTKKNVNHNICIRFSFWFYIYDHDLNLCSDSPDQSTTPSGNNDGECYWPDIKWRSENGTGPQVDMYRVIACFRVCNCCTLAVVLHRLADNNRNFVPTDGDPLYYGYLRRLCAIASRNRWSNGPTYFTNERACVWDPCC